MQIFVCVKDAIDWNLSTKDFRIDRVSNEPTVSFARYRIDEYDEIALEVALQVRDRSGGTIRALSVGSEATEDILKHALSMKADAATLIEAQLPVEDKVSLLCAAIRRQGPFKAVLCGLMSSGSGTGATGPSLAEELEVPCISNITSIEAGPDRWRVRRETSEAFEELAVMPPFVGTVTNAECNLPRAPTMKDKIRAFRQQVEVLRPADLAPYTSGYARSRLRIVRRYVPHSSRECRKVGGDAVEKAREVASYVRRILPQFA